MEGCLSTWVEASRMMHDELADRVLVEQAMRELQGAVEHELATGNLRHQSGLLPKLVKLLTDVSPRDLSYGTWQLSSVPMDEVLCVR